VLRILKKLARHLGAADELGPRSGQPVSLADPKTRRLIARGILARFTDRPARLAATVMFHLKRAIRKLRIRKLPIRVVFLAQDPLNWLSVDSLYQSCLADPVFQVHVINVGFKYGTDYATDCANLFRQNQIPFLDGVNNPIELGRLSPDIIVLSSPYDDCRPAPYRTRKLLRRAKTLYICYGPDFADRRGVLAKQVFGIDTQRYAWRIVTRSSDTIGEYKKHGNVPARRILCLGHPRMDQFYSGLQGDPLPQDLLAASAGKFKVIYSPHHSLEGWSTFLRYGTLIRQLIRDNTDLYVVFRPHPLLEGSLKQANIMKPEVFRSLFQGERCCWYTGSNYYDLFRWSNALVSDASSFLVEYAPTRQPIVYLNREDGWGGLDDTLRENVLNSCYVVRSAAEIGATLQQLAAGHDPLRLTRLPYQENMSQGMFTGGAGTRVAEYLKKKLA
jgi:hypothetical protein